MLTGFLSNFWIHGNIIWTLQESKSNWLTIKRALQLVVEDTDTAKYYSFFFITENIRSLVHIYIYGGGLMLACLTFLT